MEVLELMKARRSIRRFTEEKVGKEAQKRLLTAGLLAPSGRNIRPVELIVVEEREKILALKECKDSGARPLEEATLAIAVVADRQKTDIWAEDCCLAAIYMQLAAAELGLGSCWIQIAGRPKGNGLAEEAVRQVLNLPERYGIVCVVAFGHPAEKKPAYTEEELDFSRIRRESY